MLLGFKTQLKVNKQQRILLSQHAGVARHAWNSGLALCQQVLIHNKHHLEYKTLLYGSKLVIVDRFYPSRDVIYNVSTSVERRKHLCHYLKECLNLIPVILSVTEI
jgi:transposase